jgi:hypothetical protein
MLTGHHGNLSLCLFTKNLKALLEVDVGDMQIFQLTVLARRPLLVQLQLALQGPNRVTLGRRGGGGEGAGG